MLQRDAQRITREGVGIVGAKLRVYGWLWRDNVRSSLMTVGSSAEYLGYRLLRRWNPVVSLRLLMRSHRHRPHPRTTARVKRELPAILGEIGKLMDARWVHATQNAARYVARRSIILKWPRRSTVGVERGVLLISFTTCFPYFYLYTDIERLRSWFTIVLEPSWAGYCLGELLFWAAPSAPPVIVQATEKTDYEFIASLGTNLVPVDFGASNWVDHTVFRKLEGIEKRYDAIYVANYKPIKRHHVLFRAIRAIGDPTFKLALVCTPWGTRQTVLDLIEHYGLRDNVDIYEGLSPERLNELLNESKVSVLMSLKEGSNRSIFEGFFSDVPGVVLRNNVGINKSYINEFTGRLIDERDLPCALQFFREHWREFSPRAWALRHLAAPVTTQALEVVLRGLAARRDEPWTSGLQIKVNKPEVEYFNSSGKCPLSTLQLLGLFARSSELSAEDIERQLLGSAL